MTTPATPSRARSAVDLAASIVLMIVGVIVLVLETIMDVLLALTSADSPGDIEGATDTAFLLLFIGGIVWLVGVVVAIIFLVRRRPAWWVSLIGVGAPIVCSVGGFVAVTSVVQ